MQQQATAKRYAFPLGADLSPLNMPTRDSKLVPRDFKLLQKQRKLWRLPRLATVPLTALLTFGKVWLIHHYAAGAVTTGAAFAAATAAVGNQGDAKNGSSNAAKDANAAKGANAAKDSKAAKDAKAAKKVKDN